MSLLGAIVACLSRGRYVPVVMIAHELRIREDGSFVSFERTGTHDGDKASHVLTVRGDVVPPQPLGDALPGLTGMITVL